MAKPLDLDAYLERIKYTGSRTPTYDASLEFSKPISPASPRKLRRPSRPPHSARPRGTTK